MKTTKTEKSTIEQMSTAVLPTVALVLLVAGCAGKGGESTERSAAPVSTGSRSAPAGSLIEPRDGAACALIGTSSVLVAGGRTARAEATDTAEIVEASGTVRPVLARMATARAGARAVSLDADRVLVIGGHDESGRPLDSTEIYSRSTRTFSFGPTLTAPRDGSAVAFVGSLILVFGGAEEKSVEAIETAELTTKRLGGSLERSHVGAQVAVVGSRAVVGGGADADAPEVYDLESEKTVPQSSTDPRRGETIAAIGTKILLIGGASPGTTQVPATRELADGLRPLRQAIGLARSGGTSVAFMNGVLVLGGEDLNGPVAETDLVRSARVFERGPKLETPRRRANAVALADGSVIVVGGTTSTGAPVGPCEILLAPGATPPPTSPTTTPTTTATTTAKPTNTTQGTFTPEETARAAAIRELDANRKLLAQALTRSADAEKKLAAAIRERDSVRERIARARSTADSARQAIEYLGGLAARGKIDEGQLQFDTETSKARIREAESQIASLGPRSTPLDAEVSRLTAELDRARNDVKSTDARVQALIETLLK